MTNFEPSKNELHFNTIFIKSNSDLALKEDDKLLESLIALPENINFNFVDGSLNNILYLAAANNKIKTVSYLLCERRVNPNIRVSEGLTAAHIASAQGNIRILPLLVDRYNIDLTLQDQYGETPLFRGLGNAPQKTLVVITQLLIQHQPKLVFIPNEDGMMPIEMALVRQSPTCIRLLLEKGAEVSKRCLNAATSMMMEQCTQSVEGGYNIFDKSLPGNDDLAECAKLIIDSYNQNNLFKDLKAFETNSGSPIAEKAVTKTNSSKREQRMIMLSQTNAYGPSHFKPKKQQKEELEDKQTLISLNMR